MALLDAYVSLAEYRARTGSKATAADATLTAQITAVARLMERSLGVAAGAFNSVTSAARVFDGGGRNILHLRDREGHLYFLQTIDADGLAIDDDMDGAYDDYLLDFNDAWVRGLPENAAVNGEPYTSIELRPLSAATMLRFPALPGCVRITGTWGWSAVPGIIKELNAHLTHDLEQAQLVDETGSLPAIDSSLPLSDQTWRFWRLAERHYGYRVVTF